MSDFEWQEEPELDGLLKLNKEMGPLALTSGAYKRIYGKRAYYTMRLKDAPRRAWSFIHEEHEWNVDAKWAKRERFLVGWAVFMCVGLYTGWLGLEGSVINVALLAFIIATTIYFNALNRKQIDDQHKLLEAYGELCDDSTKIMAQQRDQILAYRLRDDMQGEGWKDAFLN